jgi:hypothetical protein
VSKRTCSVEGCERPSRCRGWCTMHYQRWLKWGETAHRDWGARSQFDRAMEKVDRNGPPVPGHPELGPCWIWTGPVRPDGYIQIEGRRRAGQGGKLLHRLVYEELVGPIPCYPEGHREAGQPMPLDHLCHTLDPDCFAGRSCPHRKCCNPAHLEPVTREENHRRGAFPNSRKTHCPKGHPYDEENTYRPPSSPNRRQCRACGREASRRFAAEKKAS